LEVNRQGEIDWLRYQEALNNPRVLAVTAMRVNNETGIEFPIAEMAVEASNRGIYFHVDGACAVGKSEIRLSELGIDSLTLARHKFHAHSGIGALVLHSQNSFSALVEGGVQERGRRAGTENVIGILALSLALDSNSDWQRFHKHMD